MFESQGTTPELVKAVETRQATLEAQALTIIDLEAKVAELQHDKDFWMARTGEKVAIIEKACKAIEEVLAGDISAGSTFEDFREAFELLGVKGAREVEIEISVTWRGTIELPLDMEVSDLDIDDFGIEINGHHEYEGEIRSHFESYSIDER
jgi:hypothetical protein